MDYSLAVFAALSEPKKSILALFVLSEKKFSKARLMYVLRAAHALMVKPSMTQA